MTHTQGEYQAYDKWCWQNAQIKFGDLDKLKNSPDEAREDIQTKLMELFHNEQARLEAEGKSPELANSIERYSEILEDDVERGTLHAKGDLALKMDETEDWQDHLDVGEEWDESIGKWGSYGEAVTPEERTVAEEFPELPVRTINRELSEAYGDNWEDELTKGEMRRDVAVIKKYGEKAGEVIAMPSAVEPEKTPEDYVDESIPFVTKTKRDVTVSADIQREIIDVYGPNWRDFLTLKELKARGVE